MNVNTEYLSSWPDHPSHSPVDPVLFDLRERAARAWARHSGYVDECGPNAALTLAWATHAEELSALASARYRELNAPTTIALGNVLLDPDAPAEQVNAALSEWRKTNGYEEE